jgi:hypothetical protein
MASTLNATTASGGGIIASGDSSGILQLQTGGTTAVTVDASQNVGVGTASPAYKLDIQNAGNFSAQLKATAGNYAQWSVVGNAGTTNFGTDNVGGYVQTVGAIPLLFYTSNTERARFDTSGNLLVGQTTNGATGKVAITTPNGATGSAIATTNVSGTAQYYAAAFYNNGTTNSFCGGISVSGSLTTYAVSSDYRLKENIVPLTGALDKIAQLKPSLYNYKADPSTLIEGFIAHELQAIVPHAVVGEKDAVDADGNPVYQGVDASFLIPHLVAAIQELKTIIDTQAAKIAALEVK